MNRREAIVPLSQLDLGPPLRYSSLDIDALSADIRERGLIHAVQVERKSGDWTTDSLDRYIVLNGRRRIAAMAVLHMMQDNNCTAEPMIPIVYFAYPVIYLLWRHDHGDDNESLVAAFQNAADAERAEINLRETDFGSELESTRITTTQLRD